MEHGGAHSRDEIIALLFKATMSGNPEAFARENGIDPATMRTWKVQYLADYVRFLESVLFRIKDQIDY
jgi:hypothetical protein